MAAEIQAKLPIELKPLLEEIKEIRAKRLEPTDTKQTVIDAIKFYHKEICK